MNFNQIKPFIRFARSESITKNTVSANIVYGVDCRLIYLLSESALFSINGQEERLKSGDMLIINSNVPYQALVDSTPIECININFDYTFNHSDLTIPIGPNKSIDPSSANNIIEHITFDNFTVFNVYATVRNAFFARNILDKIIYEYNLRRPFYDLYISNLLTDILVTCARHYYSSKLLLGINHKVIDDILKYIYAHYNEPLSNTELGNIFGFHANYIGYLIKSYTGISAHQYLLQIRMEKALSLLQTTNDSIENIAAHVGLSSAAYFSRYFKKIYGISPSAYRKSHYI